jgi:hypothetical protein
MKSITHAITGLIASAMIAMGWAQQPEVSFLNFANMVPNAKACKISFDDKDLMPGGLKSIEATGWFMVPKGSYKVTVEIEGYKPAKGSITTNPDESLLYVIFLQQIGDKKDEEGKVRPPEVRIKRCPALEQGKGHTLQVMSLCPEPEQFKIGSQTLNLELFGTQDLPKWNGGAFNVMHKEKVIGANTDTQEKGAYTLLIGSNHKRTCSALLVRNEKQQRPVFKNPQ